MSIWSYVWIRSWHCLEVQQATFSKALLLGHVVTSRLNQFSLLRPHEKVTLASAWTFTIEMLIQTRSKWWLLNVKNRLTLTHRAKNWRLVRQTLCPVWPSRSKTLQLSSSTIRWTRKMEWSPWSSVCSTSFRDSCLTTGTSSSSKTSKWSKMTGTSSMLSLSKETLFSWTSADSSYWRRTLWSTCKQTSTTCAQKQPSKL